MRLLLIVLYLLGWYLSGSFFSAQLIVRQKDANGTRYSHYGSRTSVRDISSYERGMSMLGGYAAAILWPISILGYAGWHLAKVVFSKLSSGTRLVDNWVERIEVRRAKSSETLGSLD
jgi:hypothetical protein